MHRILSFVFFIVCVGVKAQPDTSVYRQYSLEHVNELIRTTKNSDTLAGAYYHRARKTFLVDNEECIKVFQEALPIIKDLGKDSVYYQAKMFYVLPLINGTRFETAYEQIQECKNYYQEHNELLYLASAFALEGFLQKELSNYNQAADLLRKSLEIYKNNDFSSAHYGINNVNNHLGIVYTSLDDHEKAIEYFQNVRNYSTEKGVTYFYRAATNNVAESLIALDRQVEAIPLLKEVIEIRKSNTSIVSKISMYSNLAQLSEIENEVNLAISYQDSSLFYAEKLNNYIFIVDAYLKRSKLYKKNDQFDLEISALLQAKQLSLHYGIQSFLPDIYLAIAENEFNSDHSTEAAKYYQKHIAIKDSLNKIQQLKDIEKREAALAIQKFDEELLRINANVNLKTSELAKQKERNRFLLIFSVFTIGLISLLFRNNRAKKKSQVILAKQNTEIESNLEDKEILLKEIHHRVKNNLQVVSSMLNLNLRYVKDPAAKEILLESRNRVKSMALIHQKLYQEDHLKGVKLETYLESLANNLLFSYKNNDREIRMHFEVDDIILDVDTLIPLGLIANEILSNSLKHAFVKQSSGNIWIKVKRENERLVTIIKDDGIGFDYEKKLKAKLSFGMTLIESLAEKLKAQISFDSKEGTEVKLEIEKFSIYN